MQEFEIVIAYLKKKSKKIKYVWDKLRGVKG